MLSHQKLKKFKKNRKKNRNKIVRLRIDHTTKQSQNGRITKPQNDTITEPQNEIMTESQTYKLFVILLMMDGSKMKIKKKFQLNWRQ